jgi:hypothetical protein
VLVQPLVRPGDVVRDPDMGTEKAVARSQVVLAVAASALGQPLSNVDDAVSVSVPVDASILVFDYTTRDRQQAHRGAAAVAAAYVAYVNEQTATPPRVRSDPAVPGMRASIISRAGLPTSPSSPNFILDVLSGAAAGLLLGILFAFASDRLSSRLPSVTRWQDITGVPVLMAKGRNWHPRSLAGLTSLTAVSADPDIDYVRIRAGRFLPPTGGVLLVTSCREHPLAGVVARQLAVAFASQGLGTVLIKATEVGAAEAGAEDPRDKPQPGRVQVHVVATWPLTDRGCIADTEPATISEFKELVESLAGIAHVVIIDGPAVEPHLPTLDIAAVADAALLVDDASKARRSQALAAVTELTDEGCPVRGGVLTGLSRGRRTDTFGAARTTSPDRDRPTGIDRRGPQPPREPRRPGRIKTVNHTPVPAAASNTKE